MNREHYKNVVTRIRSRVSGGKKVRIAFFVVYDSVFPARPLLNNLKIRPEFEVTLVIIPDVARGKDNMLSQINKCLCAFKDLGVRLISGFNEDDNTYPDLSDEFDLICFSNPYDELTHRHFGLDFLRKKHLLPFYIDYTFSVTNYCLKINSRLSMQYFWKIFLNTHSSIRELRTLLPRDQLTYGYEGNFQVTGFCKMDDFPNHRATERSRQRIIIAPHHTILPWKDGLEIGGFLRYADLVQELPLIYPGIDFIFRPHPLLLVNLRRNDLWGQERTNSYLQKLLANSNVTFSDEAGYFDLFVNSDALIHDCGSFVAEYLFTGNPACFIMSKDMDLSDQFCEIGRQSISQHYTANDKNDFLNFIDKVVIGKDDPKSSARTEFVSRELKVNYPNASMAIENIIREAIGL